MNGTPWVARDAAKSRVDLQSIHGEKCAGVTLAKPLSARLLRPCSLVRQAVREPRPGRISPKLLALRITSRDLSEPQGTRIFRERLSHWARSPSSTAWDWHWLDPRRRPGLYAVSIWRRSVSAKEN